MSHAHEEISMKNWRTGGGIVTSTLLIVLLGGCAESTPDAATYHDGVTGLDFTWSSHDLEEFGMISRIRAIRPPSFGHVVGIGSLVKI